MTDAKATAERIVRTSALVPGDDVYELARGYLALAAVAREMLAVIESDYTGSCGDLHPDLPRWRAAVGPEGTSHG